MKEIWKDIKGYEGIYQASTLGRARRIQKRYDSLSVEKDIVRVLKAKCAGKGYLCYCLCWQGKKKYRNAHRLIAETFIPNPDSLPQVNHIDGDKKNNRVDNLEWMTVAQNHTHAAENGLAYRGELNGGSRITESQAKEIRALVSTGNYFFWEIAEKMEIGYATVGDVARATTWSHLGHPIQIRKRKPGAVKLPQDRVEDVKLAYIPGETTLAEVGDMFGIKRSQVWNIVNGRSRV